MADGFSCRNEMQFTLACFLLGSFGFHPGNRKLLKIIMECACVCVCVCVCMYVSKHKEAM